MCQSRLKKYANVITASSNADVKCWRYLGKLAQNKSKKGKTTSNVALQNVVRSGIQKACCKS
jgi:hypothetical protein